MWACSVVRSRRLIPRLAFLFMGMLALDPRGAILSILTGDLKLTQCYKIRCARWSLLAHEHPASSIALLEPERSTHESVSC